MRTCLRGRNRRGMTLPELLIASAVTAMIGLTLAGITAAVNTGNDHVAGRATATQHARVTLERIRRTIDQAHGSESFPACVVFADTIGTQHFPDTLVVWQPTTTATNPTDLPTVGELVIYAPAATDAGVLLECTNRSSTAAVPTLSNTTAWFTLIDDFLTSNSASRVELTNLVRTAEVRTTALLSSTSAERAAIRFHVFMTPSETEWTQFRAGTRTWDNVAWPLDFRGANVGVRRVVCQLELQLLPRRDGADDDTLPFFGSFPHTHTLNR